MAGKTRSQTTHSDSVSLSKHELEELVAKITSEITRKLISKIDEMEAKISQLIQENQHRNLKCSCQMNKNDEDASSEEEEQEILGILETSSDTIIDTTVKTNDTENKNHQRTNRKKRKYKSTSNQLMDPNDRKTYGIKNRFIVGNAECSEENPVNFSAALKRAWVHVGKVKTGTTIEDVRSFLQLKYPGNDFDIEAMPQRPKSRSMSFKVGANFELLSELYKPENWPAAVIVKKFQFRFFRKDGAGVFK
ncbi:hypothetical protein Zmor_026848 [Zophobas morio]|uniref:Uncharacterized protein n=1 Tax=Zophobas morio TaxID=2755281 RepID=A0AA38HW35_9CUCU|nr:hypothetical protein Zmor_026848 [Zophobas morio]